MTALRSGVLIPEHHTEVCGTDAEIWSFLVILKQRAGLKSLNQHDVTSGKVCRMFYEQQETRPDDAVSTYPCPVP